ncbi:MAG: NUDIX hydrolase [Clostridiales bacterium]|nr:NUDIX hydrolase [Clostridiales bacterium]
MMKRLNIIDVKEKKELEYLKGYEISYEDSKRKLRKWELVSREGLDRLKSEMFDGKSYSDGTMICAMDKGKERVVLIREYRVPAGKYLYSMPAGLMDGDEDIMETAKREFHEETGLVLKPAIFDTERYTSVGLSNEKVTIVYGYYEGTPSSDNLEDNEDIEVIIADKSIARRLLSEEEVTIRTALILQRIFNLAPVF